VFLTTIVPSCLPTESALPDSNDEPSTIQFISSAWSFHEGYGTLWVYVSRTGDLSREATVTYSTADGTAAADSDYTATSGTLSWSSGDDENKCFGVAVTQDTVAEGTETFLVTLSDATGADLAAPTQATVSILDDDIGNEPSTIQFTASARYAVENGGTVRVYVSRTGNLSTKAKVSCSTVDGTATAGSDYTAASGPLSWSSGDGREKCFEVAITDDVVGEGTETFSVSLSDAAGVNLGARSEVKVTISDDDNIIDTVSVVDARNAPDTTGYGAVRHWYLTGKFEITAGQYAVFLNAVAKTDTYGLYNPTMADPYANSLWLQGGCNIQRAGEPGSHVYSVAQDWARRPVNYVSWGDAARFANWMHNGQPTGAQDLSTTEDGSYYLNGATTDEELLAVTRDENATWVIPTEDEWYKAAYYDPTKLGGAGYWAFPTRSDSCPSNVLDATATNNANCNEYFIDCEDYCADTPPVPAPYYRSEVGAFAASPSYYGTFDQGGNVAEWNETLSSNCRGIRGGSYLVWDPIDCAEPLSANQRSQASPTFEDARTGFRIGHAPRLYSPAGPIESTGDWPLDEGRAVSSSR
jgi:formylglycine-generating enzyme required for sulfatase activity